MARERRSAYIAPSRFALRTPLLPLRRFTDWANEPSLPALRASLQALIDSPELRDAIFVASPDLDASIEAWRSEPDSQRGQRVERSLVRYLSRMSFRATPFGLFASVSVGQLGGDGTATDIALPESASYKRSTRIDNDYLFALCDHAVANPTVREALDFRPNSSLYMTAGRLRYAESRLDGKARSHHLVAVEPSDYLLRTLERAADGAKLESLAAALVADDPDIAIAEAEEFVAELVDSQMLVSDLSPNVTGPEPIHHCLRRLRDAGADAYATPLAEAQAAIEAIDAGGIGSPASNYLEIAETLKTLPIPVELGRLFQVDTAAPTPDANLSPRVLAEIERAIATLGKISPRSRETSLARFAEAFTARYESREVPLSIALDEEVGVGFDSSNAPGADASPLLAGLPFPANPNRTQQVSWLPRDDHLLELLTRAARRGAVEVELAKSDIEALAAREPARLPDAFSLMTTLVANSAADVDRGNFKFILEGAGGPSGARILGRFCIASEEHDELVREHIAAEESLVPGAVFAEVAHLPEGRIGNILCRPVLRDYEIPFLGISGADEDKQLPASDLLVSVRFGRVVLRSARLGCEVIPRLSTAHNYGLRSLGVYRFLCSLQSQGSSGIGWSWGPLAGATFLPRVRFGRHIMAKAKWRLTTSDLKPLADASKGAKKATKPEQIRELRKKCNKAAQAVREARDLPRFVVLADGDNELPVDFDNPLSVDSFVALVKNRPGAELTELYPGPDDLIVRGPKGSHCHQIVIPLVRAAEPVASSVAALPGAGSGRFASGSRWLYAKFYTGTSTADDILRQAVWPIVQEAIAAGTADRWFFIRYSDPGWHIRVRFRGDPETMREAVLPALEAAAANALGPSALAWKFQLDTYERETSRYGGDAGIDLAEELFFADSEAVCEIVDLLDGDEGEVARWQLCLRGIDHLLDDLGFDLGEKRGLIGQAKESFAREFHADTSLKKELGKRYRSNQDELSRILLRDPAIDAEHPFEPGFAAFAKRSPRQQAVGRELRKRRDALTSGIGDIALSYVHMHANRLLRSAARAQELVLYDFLKRYYDMRVNRG